MKRDDVLKVVAVAIFAAVISLVIAGAIFNSPAKHNKRVPQVAPISTSFPDVTNDPDYNTIFNAKALDPTQPVQIGNSTNTSPFVGTQQ